MPRRTARFCSACCLALLLSACSGDAPSWARLVEERILSHYPSAKVERGSDALTVDLEGRQHRIELGPIILQCNRGISDCERAMTDMLLELGKEPS
jgi:hypothetical protein